MRGRNDPCWWRGEEPSARARDPAGVAENTQGLYRIEHPWRMLRRTYRRTNQPTNHPRTRLNVTERRPTSQSWFTRWREHRRAKRQQALERRYHETERLDPCAPAYPGADNNGGRWTSFFFGGGGGGGAW